MNRIILIGNGFDLAHGLPTKYTDFVNSYWADFKKALQYKDTGEPWYADDFITINYRVNGNFSWSGMESYQHILSMIREKFHNISEIGIQISYKNEFFAAINRKPSEQNWLDIENEYYRFLKSYLKQIDPTERNKSVKKLNDEFCQVKNRLEKYLTEVCEQSVECNESISTIMDSQFRLDDVALSKQDTFLDNVLSEYKEFGICGMIEVDMENHPEYYIMRNEQEAYRAIIKDKIIDGKLNQYIQPHNTLILSFNYTDTAKKLYALSDDTVVNIHGELNNPANPIIFGYGDELDDDYKEIEKTNDNDFLDNIKSIQYHNTDNYRKLLSFLEGEPYHVFIMGHSCGNSDRTLLNTIFEHENCISIKPFFYQWRDEKSDEIKDNYTELTKNISRNFNDKQKMRDIVVNRKYCQPLVPCREEEKVQAGV